MRQPLGDTRYFLVGGGIAGLSAAAFLVRDAGVSGPSIRVLESASTLGGSLDGAGDPDSGYLTRGGRMFEEHFVCTLNLFGSIPSFDDPGTSITEDILAFNRATPGSSRCRLVRGGKKAPDRDRLRLGWRETGDLNLLLLTPERRLESRRIDHWFRPAFFETNFWTMWSTMFAFQPWHSAAELRRYLHRFIHLFPGFKRIEGVLRTRYNQYDSLVVPLRNWLVEKGVVLETDSTVTDVELEGEAERRHVRGLVLDGERVVEVGRDDRVLITLGSMTDGSQIGSATASPDPEPGATPAWTLWRKLAAGRSEFGRPEVFCGDTQRSAWSSFTATLDGPDFFDFMEEFTGNRTGTGGLVTFDDSGWRLSIVMFHQPHFPDQPGDRFVFWGYGLRGDRNGDFVRKPMWRATGQEILQELAGQLRLGETERAWFEGAKVRPVWMPFITSQFLPREAGDRPPVRPEGAGNFAFMGQFCEMPRDCVFTVEYSVRSAWTAVHKLSGRVPAPPPVRRTDRDPMVLLRAAGVLLRG
ncbi:MAG: oleate hydratase [Paracoccaceae bacterium]